MKKVFLFLLIVFGSGYLSAQHTFSTSSASNQANSSTTVKDEKGNVVKVKTIKDFAVFTDILAEIDNLNQQKLNSSKSNSDSFDSKIEDANERYENLLRKELKKKGISKEDKDLIQAELDKLNPKHKNK